MFWKNKYSPILQIIVVKTIPVADFPNKDKDMPTAIKIEAVIVTFSLKMMKLTFLEK